MSGNAAARSQARCKIKKRGEIMILKVVRLENSYVVHYASGRIRTFLISQKLPRTIWNFIENHEITVEKYGNVVAAVVWK